MWEGTGQLMDHYIMFVQTGQFLNILISRIIVVEMLQKIYSPIFNALSRRTVGHICKNARTDMGNINVSHSNMYFVTLLVLVLDLLVMQNICWKVKFECLLRDYQDVMAILLLWAVRVKIQVTKIASLHA